MFYDYHRLIIKIYERFGDIDDFAKVLGISRQKLMLKLNNKEFFEQCEIIKACDILNIKDNEINSYFFNMISQ